jgi:hypothetical protein
MFDWENYGVMPVLEYPALPPAWLKYSIVSHQRQRSGYTDF